LGVGVKYDVVSFMKLSDTLNPMTEFSDAQLDTLLQSHFGMDEFRLGQREIIQSALSGQDAIAVLPTGGGKSLCYQYPALVKNKLVVVISPLIALMKDQVDGLSRIGIRSGFLHSGQTENEKREVFYQLNQGGAFVLYLSPERTAKEGFQKWIQGRDIALFAIDEAHCVSQWGHDFREEYAQLKILKNICPQVPILALTASATPFVLKDIAKQLDLRDPIKHVHGFYRPNLYYQVEPVADDFEKMRFLRQAIKQFPQGRILIYCGTRNITEELAASLSNEFPGVDFYHAGLGSADRQKRQENFAYGVSRILIATNAFGMGIDHPDVRLVIHYQMPANIDALYQEMGRAGRDGRDSTCILLYAKKDKGLQSFFITRSKAAAGVLKSRWRALDNLVSYAEGGECRHAEILTYYQDSQRIESCGHCDVCDKRSERRVETPDPAPEMPRAVKKKSAKKYSAIADNKELTADQFRVFEILKLWRKDKAKELDVPAFIIFGDKTLRELAKVHPTEISELAKIYGLGDTKIERFGRELLDGPLAQ
jgi:ATP-dependent DNA helicase RecQ